MPQGTPASTALSISHLNQVKSKNWSFFCSAFLTALIHQESAGHSYTPGTTEHTLAATVFFLDTATMPFLVQLSDHPASMEETCLPPPCPREFKWTLSICFESPPSLWSICYSPFFLTGVVSLDEMESLCFPLITGKRKFWSQVPALCTAKAFWLKWPLEREVTVLLGSTFLFLVSSLVHFQFSLIPQQGQYLHCREQIDTLFRKLSGRWVWVPSGKSNNWERFPTTWGSALIARLLFKRPPPPTLLPCFRRRERQALFLE